MKGGLLFMMQLYLDSATNVLYIALGKNGL